MKASEPVQQLAVLDARRRPILCPQVQKAKFECHDKLSSRTLNTGMRKRGHADAFSKASLNPSVQAAWLKHTSQCDHQHLATLGQ